jgi:hypothetical protein
MSAQYKIIWYVHIHYSHYKPHGQDVEHVLQHEFSHIIDIYERVDYIGYTEAQKQIMTCYVSSLDMFHDRRVYRSILCYINSSRIICRCMKNVPKTCTVHVTCYDCYVGQEYCMQFDICRPQASLVPSPLSMIPTSWLAQSRPVLTVVWFGYLLKVSSDAQWVGAVPAVGHL